ncbi:MAG: hypothetical protein SO063_09640 [Eubacteriales bacterium]|nr:hypothetical protein [Eubacteriales bacterium]
MKTKRLLNRLVCWLRAAGLIDSINKKAPPANKPAAKRKKENGEVTPPLTSPSIPQTAGKIKYNGTSKIMKLTRKYYYMDLRHGAPVTQDEGSTHPCNTSPASPSCPSPQTGTAAPLKGFIVS